MPKDVALDSSALPAFTFVDDLGGERRLALSEQALAIRAAAAALEARLPKDAVIGLISRSNAELVLDWLACVLAGLKPLVVQYPTRKQSRAYWIDSVRNTIEVAGVAALLCDDHCADMLGGSALRVIRQAELRDLPRSDASPFRLDDFTIVQLSSGTTGHRKAIEFRAGQLFTHVLDYNKVLALDAEDRIVSWLPLYHDMGYIACFVMPMLLGVDTVMMDPMTWVRRPALLFAAIERHRGTVCYMPNFGFEVMARQEPRALPTMRWWISCSEPVSAATSRKFLETIGAGEDAFAPCYAMAENVFAVSIRRGVETKEIDGVDVVSCGPAIPGVELKIVDGEIWLRSPVSLTAYLGGEDIRDAEGFYPTGDLGTVIDDEIFVTGRKQDLLIQAGRKFMLSDIDLALNRLYPWIRGRAAAVQTYDARLGTQKPLVLIECDDFFLRRDQTEIADALRNALGLDQVGVEFVPPRFLTKTSSGKFNRKTSAADWHLVSNARENRGPTGDPLAELAASFGHVAQDQPVEDILDSLSLEVLRIILTGTPAAYDGRKTLADFAAILRGTSSTANAADAPASYRIVSLADRNTFAQMTPAHIDRLSRRLGMPVTFEHVCLPPSPIILSDLIFHDYFQPRAASGNFAAVNRAFATLRSASLIVVDDAAEMLVGGAQAYGVLSHNMARDPQTDLISVRWQRYARYHDTLPLTLVAGADLAFPQRTQVLDWLSAYLDVPIFKMGLIEGFEPFTKDWDFHPETFTDGSKARRSIDPKVFKRALGKWIETLPQPLKTFPLQQGPSIQMNDLAHFCSHYVCREPVDDLVSHFDSFCIAGQQSSVAHLRKEIERQGKRYVYAASYAPEILKNVPEEYDCLVICGPQGAYEIEGPAVALMPITMRWRVKDIDDPKIAHAKYNIAGRELPESGTDWFYPFPLERDANIERFQSGRQRIKEAKRERRRRRAKSRGEAERKDAAGAASPPATDFDTT